jgi:energy-coupling factor transport system substrate-specific component
MERLEIKQVVAIGIGAAVYIILSRFAAIPTPIPNTTLQVTFAFLALMAFIYGPFVGFGIGIIGHTISDMTAYGSPWISWVLVTGFFGFAIGLLGKKIKIENFGRSKVIKFIIGWGILAPILDILIYKEPANKVFAQGIFAGISNMIVVGILGTILIYSFSKSIVSKGSLKKED